MVALGVGVVMFRRRSIAVGLVTAQALILALAEVAEASSIDGVLAAALLAFRGMVIALFLWLLVHRSREPRPIRGRYGSLARGAAAAGLALALLLLVPKLGLESMSAERSALALVAFGLVTASMRQEILFQVLGIIVVENALALAAITLAGASSLVIEVGITFDLVMISLVAGVFHQRIFALFGGGDSASLRNLRG